MNHEHRDVERCAILADESAAWKIAGLRQLDRLILALNEFAETAGYQHEIAVVIFWKPEIPPAERWLPDNSRLVLIRPIGSAGSLEAGTFLLTTRLFVARNALKQFLQTAPMMKIERSIELSGEDWQKLSDQWMTIDNGDKQERGWSILKQPGDIGPAEQLLLRRTAKTQDGFVSRYINRPISRFITRGLLKFPITPSGCTLSMLAVPFIAFLFLIRGDYAGFVAGTALFQIYNVFDGCDGEIARAKYLESEKGRRLDASCDLVATLIFVLCLGFGLFRQAATTSAGSFYLLESITACFLEIMRMARYAGELVSPDTTRPVSRRQEKIVLDASQRLFGKAGATFLFQITKRDVAFFAFLLLAISGMSSLILHFFFLYAVVTLLLALRDFGRHSSGRG